MAGPWSEFVTSPTDELAAGSGITQELLSKMNNRDAACTEGPVGGRWTLATADRNTPAAFVELWIPDGVSGLYVEATSSLSGTIGSAPEARIYASDGITTSYGLFMSFIGRYTAARVQFPVVPIPPALRHQIVSLYLDPNDDGGTALYFIRNDPTEGNLAGYGIRFS